jgi:hypothetical protein
MMHHSSYHLLLSRGRKAGLTTRELNSALSSRPVLGHEQQPGQPDCNGFVAGIDAQGHRTYRPSEGTRRG